MGGRVMRAQGSTVNLRSKSVFDEAESIMLLCIVEGMQSQSLGRKSSGEHSVYGAHG